MRYDQEVVADTVASRLTEIAGQCCQSEGAEQTRIYAQPKPWVMITSPHERCGIRENASLLMASGLSHHMTEISCPIMFRNLEIDAELIHIQYHPTYLNPHQFANHPPGKRLIATIHDLHRFEEISHLFDVIFVHNQRDYNRVMGLPRKDGSLVRAISLGCREPAAPAFAHSGRSDPVIAFHGFLSPYKGVKELIEAFSQFVAFYPNASLLLLSALNGFYDLGGQTYLTECQARAGALGLTGRVEFDTKFLPADQISSRLNRAADLIVLPYLPVGDSGSSAAVRTALASAKPVIVSEAPLFEDIGDEVVKFRTAELPNLSNILRAIWEDHNIQRWIVSRAIERVRRESFSCAAQEHLDIYRELVSRAC